MFFPKFWVHYACGTRPFTRLKDLDKKTQTFCLIFLNARTLSLMFFTKTRLATRSTDLQKTKIIVENPCSMRAGLVLHSETRDQDLMR